MKISIVMLGFLLLHGAPSEALKVEVDVTNPLNNVDEKFVGVAIDTHTFVRMWNYLKTELNNKQLLNLASGLSPCFVRVGGTYSNLLTFDKTFPTPERILKKKHKFFKLSAADWQLFIDFIHDIKWEVIFDFNQFLRKGDEWDPDNAREFLKFSQEKNLEIPFFQMGNEPNSNKWAFNFGFSAARLAKDMQQLRDLLSEFPAYSNSGIVGPDVSTIERADGRIFTEDFLKNNGREVISALTLHHYYFNGGDTWADIPFMYNTTILNSLNNHISIVNNFQKTLAPDKPVWFTETSSVSGGGLDGGSNTYVAGFMWLDKLGLSAKSGLKRVIRHSFIKAKYALISNEFQPYPDYFLTYLYKKLVQGNVFDVTSSSNEVRMYASCANPATYDNGALTVYVLNVKNEPTTLSFPQFADQMYDLYLLTPEWPGNLTSPNVRLNGNILKMENGEVPNFDPKVTSEITFEPYSFGFVVIPEAGVTNC